jgi:copper oxidase (laccase) domain-containing protein
VKRESPARLDETLITAGQTPRYALPGWTGEFGLVAGLTAASPELDFRLDATPLDGAALERWHRLMAEAGEGFRTGIVARQAHGVLVRAWGTDLAAGLLVHDGLDGHATGEPGILLAVTVADCVPVYLAQRGSGACALLHAGWRGAASGILEAGIEKLLAIGGGTVHTIAMHCGVSICGSCYEVGPEVFAALGLPRPPGPAPLDLRLELARRARRLGVGAISMSGWCTAHDGGRFHSHRASGGTAGRMAAYLGRVPA